MHSANYELVQRYYNSGRWTKKQVHVAVGRWITEEEFKELTGEDYDP